MGCELERPCVGVPGKVVAVAEVDIARAAERRESQPESADSETGAAERGSHG